MNTISMSLEITLEAEAILIKESDFGKPQHYLSIESTSYLINGELAGNVPKKREQIALTVTQYEELRKMYGDEPFNLRAELMFMPRSEVPSRS